MDEADRARAALDRLIAERREDYAGLSRLLGRNAAYVQQYVKRGSPKVLAERDRKTLARYFEVDESLFGGPPSEPEPADLVSVGQYRVDASAGHGALVGSEQSIEQFGFSRRWLKRLSASPPSCLSIIRVQGDSMNPTLGEGDDIMVDRSPEGRRPRDGIYVLRRDDTLMVKRLAVNPGNQSLTISSDNPAYPSWPDCPPESVEVIGRVIWAGRRVS